MQTVQNPSETPRKHPAVAEPPSDADLQSAVIRWYSEIPLYRRLNWDLNRLKQAPFFDGFQKLPTIDKGDIRSGFPCNFVASEAELQRLSESGLIELERTSGTSEAPTPLILPLGWWNRQEASTLRLNAQVAGLLSFDARRVTLNSPSCSGDICYTGTPPKSERSLGGSLYVNLSRHPFLWTDETLARMVEEALEWKPLFLDVDPVYGVLFALYCERQGVRIPSLKFIVSTYEYLSVNHRRIFERVFKTPVYNLYGSTETGHLMMENTEGEMIPNPSMAHLEIIDADDTGVGDLVVTTLTNEFMPLIRYKIGDLMRLSATERGPVYEMFGRAKDSLKSAQGRRVTVRQIDDCFKGVEGIVHYLLRCRSGCELYCVAENGPIPQAAIDGVKEKIDFLLGTPGAVKVRWVDYVPCEASGKYRLVQPFVSSPPGTR